MGTWSSIPAVYKIRKPLEYRLEALDNMLRIQRTLREATMMADVKAAGVEAPFVYYVGPHSATIVMEHIAGERMKEAVSEREPGVADLFSKLGQSIAKLHKAGIMHGDLTTANVIIRGGKLVFIDFGLSLHSTRAEDFAVDMRLIKETITGAHAPIAAQATDSLFEGYEEVAGEMRTRIVRRQLREIEQRGRYARVE